MVNFLSALHATLHEGAQDEFLGEQVVVGMKNEIK